MTDHGKHVVRAVAGRDTLVAELNVDHSFDPHSKRTLGVIEYYFHIASFKLCADKSSLEAAKSLGEYRNLASIQNTFTYENPFALIGGIWRKVRKKIGVDNNSAKSDEDAAKTDEERLKEERAKKISQVKDIHLRLLNLIIFCVVISTLIRLCILAYLHHCYDMALDADKPTVREGANRTTKCALKNDILFRDLANHERLEQMTRQLEFIGDSVLNSFGASTIFYGTVAASVLMFYLMPILMMGKHRIRIDLVSFIIDPKLERLRIHHELTIVIRSLVSTALNYSEALEQKLSNSMVVLGGEAEKRRQNLRRQKDSRQHLGADSIRMPKRRTHGNQEIKNFIQMILDNELRDSVRPITLTSRWHSIMASSSPVFLVWHNLFAKSVTWFVQWALIVGNLLARTQQKLDLIECKLWHDEAVVINATNSHWDYQLTLQKSSSSESEDQGLRAYLSHDGSDWNLMKLAFFVESKSFFTPKIIVDVIFLMITGLVGSTWVSLYLWMHFSIHIDKLAWLNQIRNQIVKCSSLLEQQQQHERLQVRPNKKLAYQQCCDFSLRRQPSVLGHTKNEERYKHRQLVREITVCYLNFELFRRQQKNYQKLASFTSAQATVHAAVCLVLSYLVGANLSIGKSGMILFMSTYMVGFVNIFLMCGAVLTTRMDKLMKCAMTLVARGSQSSVKSSYALHLWRRQTLDEKDLKKLYAPNIFGMLVSFETVVSFNFYLAFIYLVVLLRVDR